MMSENEKPIVIGVGGFARSGKDTFVKIAKKILKEHGYSSIRLAFADALKEEIDPFLKEYYGISAWTEDTDEKKVIRPLLVAHGCQKRIQNPTYWIDKLDQAIETIHYGEDVIFVSDCRFPNEVDWIHNKWGGWFVHVRRYSVKKAYPTNQLTFQIDTSRTFDAHVLDQDNIELDAPPNGEERHNDPLCQENADYKLEMENTIERELRLTGNKITVDSLVDNTYLNEEIRLCLQKCPFLNIK